MKYFILLLFFSIRANAELNSLGLRGKEIQPKVAGVYRILLMGPGLSPKELSEAGLPAKQLQDNLNRDCNACYEVVNASLEGHFSTRSLLLLEKIYNAVDPDLVVFYESGNFLSLDILERFRYILDEETELPVLKDEVEIFKNPCCEFVMNLFSESLRRRIAFVLNYTAIFKDSKALAKRDLDTVSSDVLRNISRMGYSSDQNKKRKFLVLMNPRGFKVDYLAFQDDLLQEILFKFLIYFYEPDNVNLRNLFVRQGFNVRFLGPAVNDLYTPPYLMYRRSFDLNWRGAELWSRASAYVIKKYLSTDGREVEDDN